jgi:hypothetical protein
MIFVAAVLVGCAHASEGPLDVPIGLPRDQLIGELRHYDYCAKDEGQPGTRETFPRCDNPGIDWRDSWVVVDYDNARAVRVQRYERWDDDARAVERWNQLVTARMKTTPATEDARAEVTARHDLPPGTRSWQAFRTGQYTVVAIYLLTPRPPENASILEEILGTDRIPPKTK